jgi:non-ribosomal peptide synthetase component F
MLEIRTLDRTIANTCVYALDEECEPVAEMPAAELYIGGTAFAPACSHRPAITPERFIAHPLASERARRHRAFACSQADRVEAADIFSDRGAHSLRVVHTHSQPRERHAREFFHMTLVPS